MGWVGGDGTRADETTIVFEMSDRIEAWGNNEDILKSLGVAIGQQRASGSGTTKRELETGGCGCKKSKGVLLDQTKEPEIKSGGGCGCQKAGGVLGDKPSCGCGDKCGCKKHGSNTLGDSLKGASCGCGKTSGGCGCGGEGGCGCKGAGAGSLEKDFQKPEVEIEHHQRDEL